MPKCKGVGCADLFGFFAEGYDLRLLRQASNQDDERQDIPMVRQLVRGILLRRLLRRGGAHHEANRRGGSRASCH